MIRFLIMFIASWSISSWVLAEVYYFAPFTESYVEKVQKAVTIPRHDEWNLSRFSAELNQLLVKLEASPASHKFPFYYFDPFTGSQQILTVSDHLAPLVWDDFRS